MTTTSAINVDINTFVTAQNQNRGQTLAGGGTLALDYNALTGSATAGGNAVTGIAGIAAGAAAINLPAGQYGNTVIVDGEISTAASTSGTDSYSLFVGATGAITLTDNNTGNSQSISNASYLVMDGAATTSNGAYVQSYIIATGSAQLIASMYAAGLEREPDFAGLEFYEQQLGTAAVPNAHAVAEYMLASPEFAKDWPALQTTPDNGGVNDQAFINELYGNILHRPPSATELNYYIQVLQGTLVVNGATLPAADRATLLEYFASSPENQADISAANGGWLINPTNGNVNLGALTSASAMAVLTTEVASGTINASGFDTMPTSTPQDTITVQNVSISGVDNTTIDGVAAQGCDISTVSSSPANLTINLDQTYFIADMGSQNETVNGVSVGGTLIVTPSNRAAAGYLNLGGTVNLAGNANFIELGNVSQGNITSPTVINGWNQTDVLAQKLEFASATSSFFTYGFATNGELGGQYGVVLTGSASRPVSLSAYETRAGAIPGTSPYAIYVGTIASDATSSMVTAINQSFHVLDVTGEKAFFYGEDPQGNTMVFYWRGDTTGAHTVLASDLTGAVELVGVSASSLTGANFHN